MKGATPDAFDLLYWDSDSVSLPGPMYCWYTRNTYLENKIREPGKTTQCGVRVDLSQVKVPLYVLASREDHIVPWQSAYRSKDLIGKDPRFVLAASGHVAGVINPPARNKRSHWLNDDLERRRGGLAGEGRGETGKLVARLGCLDEAPFQRHRPGARAAGQCQISGDRNGARAVRETEVELRLAGACASYFGMHRSWARMIGTG